MIVDRGGIASIGQVICPGPQRPTISVKNKPALDVQVHGEIIGVAEGIHLPHLLPVIVESGKRMSGMPLDQVRQTVLFPEEREQTPTDHTVRRVPWHRPHVVGDDDGVVDGNIYYRVGERA